MPDSLITPELFAQIVLEDWASRMEKFRNQRVIGEFEGDGFTILWKANGEVIMENHNG